MLTAITFSKTQYNTFIPVSMRKYLIFAWLFCIHGAMAFAQVDTSGIYGERADSLAAAVFTGRTNANYLS